MGHEGAARTIKASAVFLCAEGCSFLRPFSSRERIFPAITQVPIFDALLIAVPLSPCVDLENNGL